MVTTFNRSGKKAIIWGSSTRGRSSGIVRNPTSRHPLFGCMKGTVAIAPGVDLTEPTCPDWEAYAERKYGPKSRLGKLWSQVVEYEIRRRADGETR
jgi:hypothetical protein